MSASWDIGRASMAEAKRIAKLAMSQGGHYLDDLWDLAEYALDENVRTFASALVTHPGWGHECN